MEKVYIVWFYVRNYPEDQGIAGIYASFEDAVSALINDGAVSDYPSESSCLNYHDDDRNMDYVIVSNGIGGSLFSR